MNSDDQRPEWDEKRGADLLGKYVLIGITYVSSGEQILRREQKHGEVVSADAHNGIGIRLDNDELFYLPPALEWLEPAPPGTYALRNSEEEVSDPDFLVRITIHSKESQAN